MLSGRTFNDEIRRRPGAVARRIKKRGNLSDVIVLDIEKALDGVAKKGSFPCLLRCISAFRLEELLSVDLAWDYLVSNGLRDHFLTHLNESTKCIEELLGNGLNQAEVLGVIPRFADDMEVIQLDADVDQPCFDEIAQSILKDPDKAASDIGGEDIDLREVVQRLKPEQLCLKSVACCMKAMSDKGFLDMDKAWGIVCDANDVTGAIYQRPRSYFQQIGMFIKRGIKKSVARESIAQAIPKMLERRVRCEQILNSIIYLQSVELLDESLADFVVEILADQSES
ncbi:hypothetical protein ACFL2R_00720 [Patescibacteria group bacterium]